jgi:hypothetical protein
LASFLGAIGWQWPTPRSINQFIQQKAFLCTPKASQQFCTGLPNQVGAAYRGLAVLVTAELTKT